MSSDLKDARWALAHHYASLDERNYEDYDYAGWQKLLDSAQSELNKYPEDIPYWVDQWRKRD